MIDLGAHPDAVFRGARRYRGEYRTESAANGNLPTRGNLMRTKT